MIFGYRQSFFNLLVVFVLTLSFLFCCGASWHQILLGNNQTMESHTACGMGDVSGGSSSNHTQSILSFLANFYQNFILITPLFLIGFVLFYFLKFNKVWFYFKMVRDRYGGFNLFGIFLNLFKTGILNPKIFVTTRA